MSALDDEPELYVQPVQWVSFSHSQPNRIDSNRRLGQTLLLPKPRLDATRSISSKQHPCSRPQAILPPLPSLAALKVR